MKNIQVLKPFYRTEEIIENIRECCDSSWTGMGGKGHDFEEEFRKYTGARTTHLLNSATAGLHLAFLQLKMKYGWSENTEVLTSGLTFVSSNHAILYNNLKPVFCDIDKYGCLDPENAEKRITKNTKAILFIGLGGNIGQFLKIIKLSEKYGLKLILDAAHMSGTKWSDDLRQVGCCGDCTVSIFSFQAVKNCPTFDSGMICWNGPDAEDMDKQSRQLSWLGIDKSTSSRSTNEGTYKWYYNCDLLGYKLHGNAISGAFGLVGLKYLEQDNEYRRELCDLYTNNLKDYVEIVPSSPDCINSRHLFQILINNRDNIMSELNKVGIYPGVHYRDNTIYPMYSYAKGTCPRAEEFSNKTITLPLHLFLKEDDIEYVCDNLKRIIKC